MKKRYGLMMVMGPETPKTTASLRQRLTLRLGLDPGLGLGLGLGSGPASWRRRTGAEEARTWEDDV